MEYLNNISDIGRKIITTSIIYNKTVISNTIITNDRRKCIHVEAETLSYIRTSLPIKRSICEGLEISK